MEHAYSFCILIPTYNNEKTLERVISGCKSFGLPILVINDGSTDRTNEILMGIEGIDYIKIKQNEGKGHALRVGLTWAEMKGFQYVISIDSDGQHYPEDIPAFIKDVEAHGSALLIGARNMNHHSVPGKSSFGNRFSNFWFKFLTGIALTDTQCGFRLYPVRPLAQIKFFTTKFEFEIEVIVKAAWKGIPVRNIPVRVKYDPEERVSHFRPVRDFARISVLNTWLVLNNLLYRRPLQWWRSLKKKTLSNSY